MLTKRVKYSTHHGDVHSTCRQILIKVAERLMDIRVPPLMRALGELIERAGMRCCLDSAENNVVAQFCPVLRMQRLK